MSMVARLDPRTWPIRWQLTALNVGVHAATLVALSVIFLAQLDGALVLARSLELIDAVQARLWWLLAVGVAIAVVVGGTLGLRATREGLRPLDRVIQAARAIESGKLDERLRPTKRDEIGELGIAFDTMLDRLAGMVASQRRFVADAAHELRTPLTALGGMVEMLQMGADRGDPSTVRRMLNTMSGEIDRLGRLVAESGPTPRGRA